MRIKERTTWTKAADRRMSIISVDWSGITAAGASAAVQNSLVGTAARGSQGSRLSSSFYAAVEQAGVGAGLYHYENA